MYKIIVKSGLVICNFLTLLFLRIYFSLKKRNNKTQPDKIKCAILSDYLNTTMLIDSKELDNSILFLITTKRYNFYNLLLNGRYKRLQSMKFVKNYSDEQQDELLSFCKKNQIDYVLLQSGEFIVPMLNYLNRNLKRNKGNSEIAAKCSLDKNIMRQFFNKNNVSAIKTITISSKEDLKNIDFFPVVLKPAVSTASEGVTLVNSESELELAYQNSLKNIRKTEFESVFIAEEFIEGRQFDIEGILHNGVMHTLCIVEESYEGFFPNFDINWYLFNAILPKKIEEKIKEVVSKALQVCEIYHGAFFCEFRIDKNGNIKIIEFANRMGSGFEEPMSDITGTNLCDIYVKSMFDKNVSIENKGEMILDKYFQDNHNLKIWTDYLDTNKIKYTSSKVVQPNNKFKISIRTFDKELIYKISDNFSLPIERV